MKSKMNYPCAFIRKELHCAYDDKDIFVTLYIPDNGRAKHPAVILSHGYNSTGADMQDMAEEIARSGVLAYAFDYCGGSTR